METSEQTKEIFTALSKFRENVKQPLKDANNPFFKSKYVPLENVVDVIDEGIKGTGLSYMQEATSGEKTISVTTHIFHSSGQFISLDPLSLPATKPDAQGLGSAITYAKRYALTAAFGLASDPDDDGNGASNNSKQKKSNGDNANTQSKLITGKQLAELKDVIRKVADLANAQAENVTKQLLGSLNFNGTLDQLPIKEVSTAMSIISQWHQQYAKKANESTTQTELEWGK